MSNTERCHAHGQLDILFIENLVIDPRYRRRSPTDTFTIHLISQIPSGVMHKDQLETLFLIGTNRLAAIINGTAWYLFHVWLIDRLMTRITSMIKHIGLHRTRLRTGATKEFVERLRNNERSKGNLFVYSYDTCIRVIYNLAMSHQNRYSSSVFFVPQCKNHQERIVCSSMSCCVSRKPQTM